jgi:hypothetical protein
MQDRNNFQAEAFPLEVLSGEFEESSEAEFEVDELEEERRGGGRGGGARSGGDRPRQGFSARRGGPGPTAGRRRRGPGQQLPRPPGPRPQRPWPRRRWPHVAWPVGVGAAAPDPNLFGPFTEEGLQRACAARAPAAPPAEPPPDAAASDDAAAADSGANGEAEFWGPLAGRIGDVVGRAAGALDTASIIDLTASADKSHRKGTRDPQTVYALVLHQMACCFKPKDPLKRFLTVGAHFAITEDGRILQLHPVNALVWASNGFNNRSVAVEFAGNFPSTKGRWWKGETYGMNRPTAAQVTAGRQLIRHLMRTMGLTHILAHRQSSGTRENDPGPDLWFDVGQWAVNTLGLKDGGPGFKIDTGNPIPDEWRTWGSRRPVVTPEVNFEDEFMPETELAHDVWDREHHEESERETIMHNTPCRCRQCAGAAAGSFETETFADESGTFAGESELSDEEEVDLALELLTVSSEAELDQFLGKLFKGAWKGIKKVGSAVGKIAKPLGGVLRSVAKKALPLVGGALGSFIPIPGVGTAVGSALGGAIGKALEAEAGETDGEDRELEIARRFVRLARTAAQQAAVAPAGMDEETAATQAVAAAARRVLPNFQFNTAGVRSAHLAQQGRWIRRGGQVVLIGA